jgi:hypothetical protein
MIEYCEIKRFTIDPKTQNNVMLSSAAGQRKRSIRRAA